MAEAKPKGYSGLQIGLHWTVALLVVLQFLDKDGIEEAWDAIRDGQASPPIGSSVTLHVVVGATIFVLALWRIGLRLMRGAPPSAPKEPRILHLIGVTTHFLLYALIIGMPITGSLAWFAGVEQAASVHVAGKTVLFFVVLLHTAGALFEQFVLKTGILTRMAVPGASPKTVRR